MNILRKIKFLRNKMMILFLMLITHPVWADLPKPPDKDIANATSDWEVVGGSLAYRLLSIFCILLGVVILVSVAATIMKAFHVAQEKQDLGHFFKTLGVGLLSASLGIGLLYAAYQIIPQSG